MNCFAPWDNFLALIATDEKLAPWLRVLPAQIESFMESGEGKIYQNLTRRLRRLNGKKAVKPDLNSRTVSFQGPEDVSEGERDGIRKLLQEFMP